MVLEREARRDADHRHAEVQRLRPVWRAAAEGVGLSRLVHVVSGPTTVVPTLENVRADGSLVVRLLPGQLPTDVEQVAPRLAPWLGSAVVRVDAHGPERVVVRRLAVDPLARAIRAPRPRRGGAGDPALLVVDEDGRPVATSWQRRPHMVVQGGTGSGKSVFTYGLLADAAGRREVRVCGIDPTGLLWRPWAGRPDASWRVSGLAEDLAPHVALLERLVAEMDRRVAALPEDEDLAVPTDEDPLLVVVLEEYAGLLRAADNLGREIGRRVRALVARLLSEGRKAAVRVVLLVQRAEASMIGAWERGQAALRVSFAVDTSSAVELLHPKTAGPLAEDHTTAAPGVALLTMPGVPLLRARAVLLDHREYAARVRAA